MKPDSVKDIVAQVLGKIKEKKSADISVIDIWKETAGRKTARHTRPAFFKAGTLMVNAENTSWLYELNIRKPLLLRKMKKRVSDGSLKELCFRVGEI